MAVKVKKLDPAQVPEGLPGDENIQAFEITDDAGHAHYARGEEEAARLAVELSEKARQ
ncbi:MULTISPECIES: hypothetical protein [unclassified Pseudomonas]|uniref:hypothetical protein n=1 Tax=unclassified Pseudomonas TaxID=196821 RepID=UPI0025D0B15C|nr:MULTISPECIES: hypothetical protein [unclassified Pseudomonas]